MLSYLDSYKIVAFTFWGLVGDQCLEPFPTFSFISLNQNKHAVIFQEKKAMEEALDKMVTTKMETQREHDVLLEQLAEAARGGQVAEIKAWSWCHAAMLAMVSPYLHVLGKGCSSH